MVFAGHHSEAKTIKYQISIKFNCCPYERAKHAIDNNLFLH